MGARRARESGAAAMTHQVSFEGVTHEFPDDFTSKDIQKALSSVAPVAQETAAPPQTAKDADPSLSTALFPRRTAAETNGAGFFGKMAADAGDISSGLLRVPSALLRTGYDAVTGGKEAPQGKGSLFTRDLNEVNHENDLPGSIVNSPITLPLAAATGGEGLLARTLGPLGATAVKQGLIQGAGGAGQDLEEAKPVDANKIADNFAGSLAATSVGKIGMGVLSKAMNPALGRLAQGLSGIKENVLRAMGNITDRSAPLRQEVQAAQGSEPQVGADLVTALHNSTYNMPETQERDAALALMPDGMNFEDEIKSLQSGKTAIAPGGRILEQDADANKRIDAVINTFRGQQPIPGLTLEDFNTNKELAASAAQDAGMTVEDLKSLYDASAERAAKLSVQASKAASTASSTAGAIPGLNGAVTKATNNGFVTAPTVTPGEGIYAPGHIGVGQGDALLLARAKAAQGLQKARDASTQAHAAYVAAKGAEGLAGMHSDLLASAQLAKTSALKAHAVADAANDLVNSTETDPIKAMTPVANKLADPTTYGLQGQDLIDALKQAGQISSKLTSTEATDPGLTAKEYHSFGQRVGAAANFKSATPQPSDHTVNSALVAVKGVMRSKLLAANNQAILDATLKGDQPTADALSKYAPAMEAMSKRAEGVDWLNSQLGNTPAQRQLNAAQFVRDFPNMPPDRQAMIVQALGKAFGDDFVNKAGLAKMATNLSPATKDIAGNVMPGKLSMFPTGHLWPRLISLGAIPGAFAAGGPAAGVGTALLEGGAGLLSSPRIASRVLGSADRTGTFLKSNAPLLNNGAQVLKGSIFGPQGDSSQ